MRIKNQMIEEVLSNQFTTIADLYQDKNINLNQISVDIIERLLREEGFVAYKTQVILLVTEINKAKRVEFCRQTKVWKKK